MNRIRRLIEPANPVSNNIPAPGRLGDGVAMVRRGGSYCDSSGAQTPLPLPHVVNHGPSPFAVIPVPAPEPANPAIALATHARRTLLFDPFLPAQLPQVQASEADMLDIDMAQVAG